jgi:nicotinate-nucleotide--dimethylbenzimidazole phosphoribosyltransferase
MHERICEFAAPIGSLGRIEELAEWLAAIHGGFPPSPYERRAIVIGAGDHGDTDATARRVRAFAAGSSAINALAGAARAEAFVANFGLARPAPPHERIFEVAVAAGTRGFAEGPAMPREHVDAALRAGVEVFERVQERCDPQILALGEMGAENAASAAAMVCALTGAPPEDVVARGAGSDDARVRATTALVTSAVQRAAEGDWRAIAAEAGGYELVGLAGVLLAAARARLPILLDGLAVGAAALLARAIEPAAAEYCVASHRSREHGHAVVLRALGLVPLLDLDLRLGEGTGAALGFALCEAAARMVCEMRPAEN